MSKDAIEWVRCPECGEEQADFGRNVSCEYCGYGPMPTASDRLPPPKVTPQNAAAFKAKLKRKQPTPRRKRRDAK